MLYNRTDLDYTVVREVIVNGSDILLLSDTVETMGTSIHQVVVRGGILLTTLDIIEAERLFNQELRDLLLMKLSITVTNI